MGQGYEDSVMEIKLSTFKVKSGKNQGRSFPMIDFINGSKRPIRLSISKCKRVLENREAIEFAIKQGGL